MQFKLKITKDILKRSAMCGGSDTSLISHNCAFALAFRELIPNTAVYSEATQFNDVNFKSIKRVHNTPAQIFFIKQFDGASPPERKDMPEQEFDVEIPDEVIEHYYGDATAAAKRLINNPVLKPVLADS